MIVAILQARISSSRLPGKVLKPILGRPMLALQIERIRRSKGIDQLVVATSQDPQDDALEALCRELGVECYRGSLEDVLDRFYRAAEAHNPDLVVRLTGDCPLFDPEVLDRVIAEHLASGKDYTSNALPPTFPDGLDCEVFSFRCLEAAWREATQPSQREHVTPFINRQGHRFKLGNTVNSTDLSGLRWTVDNAPDFEFVCRVYESLYPGKPDFGMQDVLNLLAKNPDLSRINEKIQRNEGYVRSLKKDAGTVVRQMEKSLEMQARAKKRIPGMTQLLSKRPDLFSQGVWPAYYSKAKGVEVWDLDGNKYVDMSIGGIGANVLGYADEEVNEAVLAAIAAGSSSSLNCPEEVELADLLCELHPWAEMVRYARSGGEAMTVAVRIARGHTGRDKIAFCGYHGWHDWYLAANVGTENALGEHLIPGLAPNGVPKALAGTAFPFRYNRLEELKAIVAEHGADLAAIVMEPTRNEDPSPAFIEGIHALARESGAVLVVDEISAGFRMNTGGAHLLSGLQPDIAVFSKALGNGFPIAAVIGKGSVMEAAQKCFISSTMWTEKVGPAAALATLRKHRRVNAGPHLVALGKAVQLGWTAAGERHGLHLHAGGMYPMSHFSFSSPHAAVQKALFVQLMLDRGFLASSTFYAMYAHTQAHVDAYLQAVDACFAQIAGMGGPDELKAALKGKPSVSGFTRLN
jgi:glutamate-1-semialdehyde 2,1-aminomutase